MDSLAAREHLRHVTMRYVLLFLICIPSVLSLTPLEAGTMEARVLIMNEITFSEQGNRYYVKDAIGTVTWFPRDDRLQDIETLDINEPGKLTVDNIVYSWAFPEYSEEVKIEAVIKTRNAIVPIRERVTFPIASVPPDVGAYLNAEEIIDQSPEIQLLAQELASGKDDLYEVVYTLADWTTTNVEYSLASLRSPAIQKSSEIIESKWGKCDEITALFISLNRAIGIPARFVAGYSYTNAGILPEEWGGHGWSEVWFPDVGWVPFDVTYGEYGYLDAGHVKLKVAPDAKETSADYSASGRDFSLVTEPLDVFITPLELARNSDKRLQITLEAPYTKVGFGSAVLILAEVKNLKDYYVATRLDLAKTTNTEMLSETYENVLLKPYQTITIPFLVKIDDNLDAGYRYEFPFRLLSRLGGEETINIEVNPKVKSFEASEFDGIISSYLDDPESSPLFSVRCDRGSPAYVGNSVTHGCGVEGTVGEKLTICLDECVEVPIIDKAFSVTTVKDEEGIYTDKYRARQFGGKTDFFVTTEFVAPTEMAITITSPADAALDDDVTVEVVLQNTGAEPRGITVRTDVAHSTATQLVEAMPATIQLSLPGSTLRSGENEVLVTVDWTDELGTKGQKTGSTTITLTDAGFFHKVKFFFLDVTSWFGGLFS